MINSLLRQNYGVPYCGGYEVPSEILVLKSFINASDVHRTLIVPVNSASAVPRYFV